MDLISSIHLTFTIAAILSGAIVVVRKKGDSFHSRLGKIFVASMILVNVTAFALWFKYGFTFFQPLALWNLVWVLIGYYYATKKPNKNRLINHFYFITYAYAGILTAAVARIPVSFGLSPGPSAFIAMAVVFSISAYLIQKQGKKLVAISV